MPKQSLRVTAEGIQFGKCWISHDRILKGAGPLVLENYNEWLKQALVPCQHKIGTGPEGEDICAHCMAPWDEIEWVLQWQTS
jgi:hypothetical protein